MVEPASLEDQKVKDLTQVLLQICKFWVNDLNHNYFM